MLLWYVIAICFAACVLAYHLWQGITWMEAIVLLVASGIVFSVHLDHIHEKVTADHHLVTGYVTSKMYRQPFSYKCGKRTCREPERWIVEQRPHAPTREFNLTTHIYGEAKEFCYGECARSYPAPYQSQACCGDGAYGHTILVNKEKYNRTNIGDSSSAWKKYYNPVRVSDDVVYENGGEDMPYYKLNDYNTVMRFAGPGVTPQLARALENLNRDLAAQGISVGILITSDPLYFEKIKRGWRQGKANDFLVVVTSADGVGISNVNVLGWSNYNLKENVAQAVMATQTAKPEAVFEAVSRSLRQGPEFKPANFDRYKFLSIKIPANYYWRILIFQFALMAYSLVLLRYNPNTKNHSLPWSDVARMWQKGFRPPERNWCLHPFTPSGLLLHLGVPAAAVFALWSF